MESAVSKSRLDQEEGHRPLTAIAAAAAHIARYNPRPRRPISTSGLTTELIRMPANATAVIPPTTRSAVVRCFALRQAIAIRSGNTLITAKTIGWRASVPIMVRNAASSKSDPAMMADRTPATRVRLLRVVIALGGMPSLQKDNGE